MLDSRNNWTEAHFITPSLRGLSDLPRSDYTEQPRVLTLGWQLVKDALKVESDVGAAIDNTRTAQRRASAATFRAPFALCNPGLKPWAIMYSRSAAKSDTIPTGRVF